MKASELHDGYYYVNHARVYGSCQGSIRSQIIEKRGDMVNYFSTDYWDRASEIEGTFYRIDMQDIKKEKNKLE